MSKPLRVVYVPGPGDVIGTYNYWVKGQDDPSQVAITYSHQFYDVCHALEAQAYVIAPTRKQKTLFRNEKFILERRPKPFFGSSGVLRRLGQLWYDFSVVATAVRFQADVAVVSSGGTHWFILSLLPGLGVQVIPSFHVLLWSKYKSGDRLGQFVLNLSRPLLTSQAMAILAVSDEICDQVAQLTNGQHRPMLRSFPVYRREQFAEIDAPDEKRSPFRVLFVGRIEPHKGVFELLEIAKRFVAEGRDNITFDLCGKGSALDALRLAAKEAGVDSIFVCHGHCNKPKMRQMFSQSHVVIIPTTTGFREGFNKVVVEGILAGRPVVTSAVCPDLACVKDAVVEVPADDTKAYGDALLKLCHDWEFYDQKRRGCLAIQEQFYDLSHSWGANLKSILISNNSQKLEK
jgi:glycosyltransferase involved in cell wall biosynthesis